MLAERRERIVAAVEQQGVVSFSELARLFPDISEMTLRKDLKQLDEQGRIVRIHGGARAIKTVRGTEMPLRQRLTQHIDKKRVIARKALAFLQAGDFVFLDSGSTATELAKIFPDIRCHVFTGGLSCVNELSGLTHPVVHVLGGMLNKSSLSVRDVRLAYELENYHFDVAFLSVNGFFPDIGFSSLRPERQLMEQTVLRHAKKSIMLLDSTKLDESCPYIVCPTSGVDVLISDDEFPADVKKQLEAAGVTVL
ncbi:MAG: DeoR/GlpR transcriptional regulator [Clostridia bacterium]|nr:DeoR/GlpR transcriptional regulator [Clostridia bacterium]